MIDADKLDRELADADSEQLQYIYDTQQDLYSAAELAYILKLKERRLQEEAAKEKELNAKVELYLPKEIKCHKCDGPNDFNNDTCQFCGAKLDKKHYYEAARHAALGIEEDFEDELDDKDRRSFIAQYVVSVILPIVGWIMGAIYLTRDDQGGA